MPGSLKDKLPNLALRGPELATIAMKELRGLLAQDLAFQPTIAYGSVAFTVKAHFKLGQPHPPHDLFSRVNGPLNFTGGLDGPQLANVIASEFEIMMSRDYAFQGSVAYRNVEAKLSVSVHLGSPHVPGETRQVCVLHGEAPLKIIPKDSAVVAIEREFFLKNPNLDRIHHDMPIVIQRATPPQAVIQENQLPGESQTPLVNGPGIENKEYIYDKTQFDIPGVPTDTDFSEKAAAHLGVPLQTGQFALRPEGASKERTKAD